MADQISQDIQEMIRKAREGDPETNFRMYEWALLQAAAEPEEPRWNRLASKCLMKAADSGYPAAVDRMNELSREKREKTPPPPPAEEYSRDDDAQQPRQPARKRQPEPEEAPQSGAVLQGILNGVGKIGEVVRPLEIFLCGFVLYGFGADRKPAERRRDLRGIHDLPAQRRDVIRQAVEGILEEGRPVVKLHNESALSAAFGDRGKILVRPYNEAAHVRTENADVREGVTQLCDDLSEHGARAVEITGKSQYDHSFRLDRCFEIHNYPREISLEMIAQIGVLVKRCLFLFISFNTVIN